MDAAVCHGHIHTHTAEGQGLTQTSSDQNCFQPKAEPPTHSSRFPVTQKAISSRWGQIWVFPGADRTSLRRSPPSLPKAPYISPVVRRATFRQPVPSLGFALKQRYSALQAAPSWVERRSERRGISPERSAVLLGGDLGRIGGWFTQLGRANEHDWRHVLAVKDH